MKLRLILSDDKKFHRNGIQRMTSKIFSLADSADSADFFIKFEKEQSA